MKNRIYKYLEKTTLSTLIAIFSIIFIIFFSTYSWHEQNFLVKEVGNLEENLSSTTGKLIEKTRILRELKNEKLGLETKLGSEIAKNDFFNEQIRAISSTVGQLDKLSKTDRELLQKYSNVYFLNENYIPSSLSEIDPIFLYRKEKPEKIHSNIKPHLENLIRSANVDSIQFFVLSAYRSFNTQANLKANYKITYGAGTANKFSADQGYSEHQLGSTIDFTATSTGEVLTGFEKTKAYKWLEENAHRFGFVLSYPKGNKFFKYEPWHWRFVGIELATKLHDEKKYFYDLDQREINGFLIKIFD